jgi:cell wall-associated NlpC family hydrolase
MASGRRRRFKFGYDGWGADFIGLLVVLVVLLWGIHKWNAATKHPFGLPDVPMPGVVKKLPAPVQRWLSGTVLSSTLKPEASPTPAPSVAATSPSPPIPAEPAAPSPETSSAAPATPPSVASSTPTPPAPADISDPAAEAPPVMAVLKTLKTAVRPSPNPLMASATALCQNQDLLCLGLADGGITLREKKSGHGVVVPLPAHAGPVRSVVLSRDGSRIWWLANNNLVYSYDRKSKVLRSVELPSGGNPEAISFLPGTEGGTVVVLGGGTAARFFDGNTGRMREASEVLPVEAANAVSQPATSLYCADDLSGATQASLLIVSGNNVAPGQPARITLWSTPNTSKPDAWTSQEMDVNTAPAYSTLRIKDVGRAAVDMNASGAALLARPAGGETLAACQLWTSTSNKIDLHPSGTLPKGVFGLWAAPDRIATGKSGLWWTFGGSVFHARSAETAEEKSEVYLPWNLQGKGGDKITALLADDSGAWVATGAGVRRITPAKASTAEGYGGYVRARLGEAAGKTPSAALPQKLAKTTQEWEGTPYKWGGDDKKGVDCSGYVSAVYKGLGVSLPRSTAELPTCSGGPRIRDELKYGDVLVFPGHCAVYMGNGWTSEAMTDSGVGKATIWTRKQVVVRRFLRS